MNTIELKFKLDIIFEYIIPAIVIGGFIIYYLILCILSSIQKHKRK